MANNDPAAAAMPTSNMGGARLVCLCYSQSVLCALPRSAVELSHLDNSSGRRRFLLISPSRFYTPLSHSSSLLVSTPSMPQMSSDIETTCITAANIYVSQEI